MPMVDVTKELSCQAVAPASQTRTPELHTVTCDLSSNHYRWT
jgi:hypothetical protein